MKKSRHAHGEIPRGMVFPSVSIDDDSESLRRAGHRHARLSDVLREELDALLRDDVADPALDDVRVAWVELSPDYRSAKCHVVTPRAVTPESVARALERATPFLRRNLVDAVELKVVPALRFSVSTNVPHEPDGGAPCG